MQTDEISPPDSKRLSWISDTLRQSLNWTSDTMEEDLDEGWEDDEESQYSSMKKRYHDQDMSDSFISETDSPESHKHVRHGLSNEMNHWEVLAQKQQLELQQQSEVKLDGKLTLMDYIWKEKVSPFLFLKLVYDLIYELNSFLDN